MGMKRPQADFDEIEGGIHKDDLSLLDSSENYPVVKKVYVHRDEDNEGDILVRFSIETSRGLKDREFFLTRSDRFAWESEFEELEMGMLVPNPEDSEEIFYVSPLAKENLQDFHAYE